MSINITRAKNVKVMCGSYAFNRITNKRFNGKCRKKKQSTRERQREHNTET